MKLNLWLRLSKASAEIIVLGLHIRQDWPVNMPIGSKEKFEAQFPQLLENAGGLDKDLGATSQVLLRWLNTVLVVCECTSFAKSWQKKGCSSQAETWQVKNILMKDYDWQVKCDVFVVSMATWTVEYNLKISLLLSLHKICSSYLHTAYYNLLIITIWNLFDQILTGGFLDNH